jgi:diguanylate cyclase (GGDEF)-like protein
LVERELLRTKRYGGNLAVLMMDLDHFKKINDTHGHSVGDKALKLVAATCRAALREIDIFARYGGEEFVVALPETSLERAVRVAERLRQALGETSITPETTESLHITMSIGVAVTGPGCVDLKTLLKRADEALYTAKSKGRNRVEVVLQQLT